MDKASSSPIAAPLGVALVGFGYAGATIHAPLLASTPGLALRVVVSRQPAAVHAALGPVVQVLDDPAQLFGRPDIALVVLASPNATHAPLAAAALRAGHAVVIDKPMALNADEAAPLLDLAAQQGRLLSVFHNRRWDGDFLTARALVAAGTLGRVTAAQLHFDRFRPQVRARWREGDGPGAGLYLDLAPHLLDQALQLFGAPVALAGDIDQARPGGRSDDAFTLRLRQADGARITLSASMLAALAGPRFALHGTQGSWVTQDLDAQEEALKAGQRPDPAQPQHWGQASSEGVLCVSADPAVAPLPRAWPNQAGRWPDYYAGIRDALWGRAANPVPAAQALAVLALMDLGRRSAELRAELAVPEAVQALAAATDHPLHR